MMAHEIPKPIHQAQFKAPPDHNQQIKPPKTEKSVKLHDSERRLPNGKKVDFGKPSSKETKSNSSKKNSKKNSESTSSSAKSKKGKSGSASLPNGEKPNFFNDKKEPRKSKNTKEKKAGPEETYAGSSFHSSPAALALPKPSFKTSPKQANTVSSDELNGSSVNSSSSSSSPSSNVAHAPPQHPVTAYPPGSIVPPNGMMYPPHPHLANQFIQPGFSYNYSPQGYIQYQYPVGMPPHYGQIPHQQHAPIPPSGPGVAHPGSNNIVSHYQQSLPTFPGYGHPNPQPQGNAGQKITFNDLLGSTKS